MQCTMGSMPRDTSSTLRSQRTVRSPESAPGITSDQQTTTETPQSNTEVQEGLTGAMAEWDDLVKALSRAKGLAKHL